MNEFLHVLDNYNVIEKDQKFRRGPLSTLQVNVGSLCNQSCTHCHVGASPQGRNVMTKEVIDDVVRFCKENKGLILDLTGGAPEMNPHFTYLVEHTKPYVKEILVRSNLTVLSEPGKESLPEFYKKNNVHIICSLPCYTQQNVDAQRGNGVFDKSIEWLRKLNELGYGKQLPIDLVYNPGGAFLPGSQQSLEKDYKKQLSETFGVEFNRLITITNVPIKRFRAYLEAHGEYEKYLHLLKENFNPSTVESLMCRTFLSVGYDGKLYDCDFNQALCWALRDRNGNYLTIGTLKMKDLEDIDILVGEHCFSCTAGAGSSCQGALGTEEGASLGQREKVKEYYGQELQGSKDLKTSACCTTDSLPEKHREILKNIDDEIIEKFYGCGSPIPPSLMDCTVLDLGCGTGRDVYIASYLVGEKGKVIGVDMTDEQLDVAKKHVSAQSDRFGYAKPNVIFKKGYIEDLKAINIPDNSVDVVISNCVINLSVDKHSVFKEIFRILKQGGELYFSDVFSDRRIPEDLKTDPVLYGECLSGALYSEDFRRILLECGCFDYRIVTQRKITLNNPDIEAKVGMINFSSMTVRAFKLDLLEDRYEDYGQVAYYRGTIENNPHEFVLDDYHIFQKDKPVLVCGNTAAMLQKTRYKEHFRVEGTRENHFGLFPCAPENSVSKNASETLGGCC